MSKIAEILFASLRSALFGARIDVEAYAALSAEEWQRLFRMSAKQGVLAIVYDVVSQLPKECQPPRQINLQWALSVEAIENRHELQRAGAKWLTDLWNAVGIRTVVMKGFSLSKYYPMPQHRECGDFDCFLLNNRYEDGNIIAEQNGAKVNREWYKHSQIISRGMMAENHQFLVTTRKGKKIKELNRDLTAMLNVDMVPIQGTNILLPPTCFTALFVTYHSFAHFISEGITLRHLCDWACFMKEEQNNFDWAKFYALCKKYKFDRFVDVSNEIITKHLGVELLNKDIVRESPYTGKVLNDVLYVDSKVFSSGKGKWHNRFKLLTNMFAYGWKHRDIAQSSSVRYMFSMVLGYIFKRENH